MQEQEKFKEGLSALLELAKAQNDTLTMDEIKEVFQDIVLEEDKFEPIYAYLAANKITVRNYVGKKTDYLMQDSTEDLGIPDSGSKENSESEKKSPFEQKEEAYIQMYLSDISAVNPCGEDEFNELLQRLKNGEEEAGKRITEGHLGQVVTIANQYRNHGILIGDLIQEGNLGLMYAVAELKELKDFRQSKDFMDKRIRTAIETAIEEQKGEQMLENDVLLKVDKLSQAAKQLEEELGRHPEVKEVAEFMKLTEEEVRDLVRLSKDLLDADHHH